MQKTTTNDRRQNERYHLKANIFASIGKERPIMGQIINISMSGMAMTYIADKNSKRTFDDIAQLGEEDPALENIPFISINDTSITSPDPYSSVEIRKHSGAFGDLSEFQSSRLQAFIRQNASAVNGKLVGNISFNKAK